ncbi:MAG: helix-turn-helix transcriptional regulator, partial [Selenomonadaceae bacterium]|nr:helix-turn-helix transcriptional regulator [Selenomonadaceae bacterium]
ADYLAASSVNDIDLSGYEAGAFVSLVCFDKEKWDRETSGIEGARQAAGLSIKGLADLLGAPYRTVQDWCRGKRTPPAWLQRLVVAEIERNR